MLSSPAVRSTCPRCLRPTDFCACAALRPAPSRTRVVILQHPREARLAICSAWLTRLALENAEIHRGFDFSRHPRIAALEAEAGTALLYPGDGAAPIASRAGDPPRVLVVVDATWPQATKMLRANPAIAALPRLALSPTRPSGYGELRREPADGHLPTIEAVAEALGTLERDPARFAPMVDAFRTTVAKQLACARGPRRSPRHRPGARALVAGAGCGPDADPGPGRDDRDAG